MLNSPVATRDMAVPPHSMAAQSALAIAVSYLESAAAHLRDGRTLVYGCTGSDGQPQTQAALFRCYVHCGQGLPEVVSALCWLLGRTGGTPKTH